MCVSVHVYECACVPTTIRRLRGEQFEVFKILNGYENIDRNIFCYIRKIIELEDMK